MTVYFVQAGDGGPVKIGLADDVPSRLRELQCGNHECLAVLRTVDGGRPIERWFHRRFSDLRVRGEWFTFSAEMLLVEAPALAKPVAHPLAEYLAAEGIAPHEFAELIGVTAEAVRLYVTWQRIPRPKQMQAIIDATGGKVRPNDFFEKSVAA